MTVIFSISTCAANVAGAGKIVGISKTGAIDLGCWPYSAFKGGELRKDETVPSAPLAGFMSRLAYRLHINREISD
jgi:hypothetical protein